MNEKQLETKNQSFIEKQLETKYQSFIEKHKKKLMAAAAAIGISTIAYASLNDIQKFFSKGQETPIHVPHSIPENVPNKVSTEQPKTTTLNNFRKDSWTDATFIRIARFFFVKLGLLNRLTSLKTVLSMGQLYLFFQLIQSLCPNMICNPATALAIGFIAPSATSEFVRHGLLYGIFLRLGLEYTNRFARKICLKGVCWMVKKIPEDIRNFFGYSCNAKFLNLLDEQLEKMEKDLNQKAEKYSLMPSGVVWSAVLLFFGKGIYNYCNQHSGCNELLIKIGLEDPPQPTWSEWAKSFLP